MTQDPDIEVFLKCCSASMDINALGPHWEERFVQSIQKLKNPELQARFQRGFAKAVLGGITAKEYEAATGWDFDSDDEFRTRLEDHWKRFYPDAAPADLASAAAPFSSVEAYRGWQNEEVGRVFYTVERTDGAIVLRIDEMKLVDRTLHVSYELLSPSLYDGFARQLIRQKILREVCFDSYATQADSIAYKSVTTGNAVTVPYA